MAWRATGTVTSRALRGLLVTLAGLGLAACDSKPAEAPGRGPGVGVLAPTRASGYSYRRSADRMRQNP